MQRNPFFFTVLSGQWCFRPDYTTPLSVKALAARLSIYGYKGEHLSIFDQIERENAHLFSLKSTPRTPVYQLVSFRYNLRNIVSAYAELHERGYAPTDIHELVDFAYMRPYMHSQRWICACLSTLYQNGTEDLPSVCLCDKSRVFAFLTPADEVWPNHLLHLVRVM